MNARVLICAGAFLAGALGLPWPARLAWADEPTLTAEQQARADEARQLQTQIDGLYRQGKVREALEPAKKALAIHREVFGDKHFAVALSLNNLAFLQSATGDRAGARRSFEEALAICREALGPRHAQTATSLTNLGAFLETIGDYAAARPCFEEALSIRQEALGERNSETLESLYRLAALLETAGRYAEARPYYEKHLAITREISGEKDPATAAALNNMGHVLSSLGNAAAARPYYQQALAIREQLFGEKNPATAMSLNNLGLVLKDLGEYSPARTYLEKALAIKRELNGPKHPATALALNNLGSLMHAMGDYPAARDYYQQALAIRRETLGDRHPDTGESLNNLATLHEDLRELAAAGKLLQEALSIKLETVGEKHPSTARAVSNLGGLAFRAGDYATARLFDERALAIYLELLGEEHPETATVLGNLGTLYCEMRDYEAARPYIERALAIRRKMLGEKHPDTASSLENLGTLQQATADYGAALRTYGEALAIRRSVLGDRHPDTARSLHNLGRLQRIMGNHAAALDYYQQALAIRREVFGEGNPETALTLVNLAAVMQDLGQSDSARQYAEKALAVFENTLGPTHLLTSIPRDYLCDILAAAGQWSQAAAQMDQSRRILHHQIAEILPGLSEKEQLAFLRRNDANGLYVGLTLGLTQRHDPALAALSAGWLLNDKGVAQQALAQRALLARETSRSQSPEEAGQLLALRQRLAALSMATPPPGAQQEWRGWLEQLEKDESTLARQLAAAGKLWVEEQPWIELEAVRKTLDARAVLVEIARFPLYDFAATGPAPKWLPAHYAAWIIPPAGQGDVRIVDLGEADAIDQAVTAARQTLVASRDRRQRGLVAEQAETEKDQAFREAPGRLAALALQPILAEAGKADTLIISPDAALWLVPFAALPLADGRYAIEQYAIDYVISGRDLLAPAGKAVKTSRPIVMADPDYDLAPAAALAASRAVLRQAAPPPGDQLALRAVSSDRGTLGRVDRLPGTAKEANLIAPSLAKYAGEKPTLYLQRYALEEVFKKLAQPKVVVLSTHGFFLEDQPAKVDDRDAPASVNSRGAAALALDGKPLENPLLRCGLLLAGCNRRGEAAVDSGVSEAAAEADDGILTGMEIVGTDLRGTELVVLSACETGLGEVHNGEGVAGLRQAFQLAGAQAVVASLWQVPDEQTAELMSLLFANLAAGQSKADALRGAQLTMLERHAKDAASQPFYWAAFTLTGR